jgi:NitT/TauT family transport system ATP-binding protein
VTHDLAEAVFLSDRIYMMKINPARIFKEVAVDFPRPRRPEDAGLLDLEKSLVQEFFSVLEGRG